MPGLGRTDSASTDTRLATAIYAVALGRGDSQGSHRSDPDVPPVAFSRASTPPLRSPSRLPPPIPAVPEWDATVSFDDEVTPVYHPARTDVPADSPASRLQHVSWTEDPPETDTEQDPDQEQDPDPEAEHEHEPEEYSIYLPTDPAKIAAICRFDLGLEAWYPVPLEEGGPSSLVRAARALARQPCDPAAPIEVDGPLPPPQGWREQMRTRRLGKMHEYMHMIGKDRTHPPHGSREWEHALVDVFQRPSPFLGRTDAFSTLARAACLEASAEKDRQLAMEHFVGPTPAEPPPPKWGARGTIGSEQSVEDVLASFAPPPSKEKAARQARLVSPFDGPLATVSAPALPSLTPRGGGRAKRPRPLEAAIGESPNTRPRTRPRLSTLPILGPQEKAERAWALARHMATVRNGVRWPGARLDRRGLASATVNRIFVPPEQGGVGGDSFGLADLLGFGTVGRDSLRSEALPAPRTREMLLSYLD